MKCTVVYLTWNEIEIPDEIATSGDEELIAQEIYETIPACLSIKEVQDKNRNCLLENW